MNESSNPGTLVNRTTVVCMMISQEFNTWIFTDLRVKFRIFTSNDLILCRARALYADNRSYLEPLLTLSPTVPLRLYTLPYWFNRLFLIFDIRVLWRSVLGAKAPECQKLKMMGLTSMVLDPSNSSSLEQFWNVEGVKLLASHLDKGRSWMVNNMHLGFFCARRSIKYCA